MENARQIRTQLAIATLALTRAELRIIFQSDRQREQMIEPNAFPRSRTFRWALTHPLRRWFRSGTLQGTVARLLLARFIGSRMLGR
jgi:hypothetical protein